MLLYALRYVPADRFIDLLRVLNFIPGAAVVVEIFIFLFKAAKDMFPNTAVDRRR